MWHSPSVRTAMARIDPVWLVLIAIASVQLGAAFAKDLFSITSFTATAWLRLCFASLIFLTFARPRLRGRQPRRVAGRRRVRTGAGRDELGDLRQLRPDQAILIAVAVWWLLERSTLGFEMRAVGANADAAATAGMSVAKVYTLAMLVAGALAGLAATMQILGKNDSLTANVAGSLGFDAITVALLGRATPLGTVLAGLLFGALASGGVQMQASEAATPVSLTLVLQALIVLFVAAPALVRGAFRMKDTGGGATVMAKGWGS